MKGFVYSSGERISKKELRSLIHIEKDNMLFIIVGDRGGVIRFYNYNGMTLLNTIQGHYGTVSSIKYIKKPVTMKCDIVISGGLDGIVNIWDLDACLRGDSEITPILSLNGHTDNICFIDRGQNDSILTSSWDSTAMIWHRDGRTTIVKHEKSAIWSIIETEFGYITLGADQSLRLWSHSSEQLTMVNHAHNGPLRGGVYLSQEKLILTISNDGYLKIWDFDQTNKRFNEVFGILISNTFLYSILPICGKKFLICGEDKCAYVFDIEAKRITDLIPTPSVCWGSTILPNGDICLVSEDGYIRSYTHFAERRATPQEDSLYLELVGSHSFRGPEFDEIDPNDIEALPTSSSNMFEKIGTFAVYKNMENLDIFTFSVGYEQLIKVGTIKQTIYEKVKAPDGQEFDMVIDIDSESSKDPFKLYFNVENNPYTVAHDFLASNNLPMRYIDQIIDYLKEKSAPLLKRKKCLKAYITDFPKKNSIFFTEKCEESQILSTLDTKSPGLGSGVLSLIHLKPAKECIPIIDFLRLEVLNDEIRERIQSKELSDIIKDLVTKKGMNDSYFSVLFRLFSNIFKSYSEEALDLFNEIAFYSNHFLAFSSRSQISFASLLFNASVFSPRNPSVSPKLANVLMHLLKVKMDEEALIRILIACGNIIYMFPETQSIQNSINEVINGMEKSCSPLVWETIKSLKQLI